MVQLKYKSLVTKETIDYYLSLINDEDEKKDLLSTVSKFDIRIATEPVIDEEYEEFYYKIWIWRRGTKKRAHIKLYNRLKLLKKRRRRRIRNNNNTTTTKLCTNTLEDKILCRCSRRL